MLIVMSRLALWLINRELDSSLHSPVTDCFCHHYVAIGRQG